MDLIEVDNPSLRCMVLKIYARPSLDLRRIGELVDLLSTPAEGHAGLCLRALPRPVRLRRGQGLRRVYTHQSVDKQLVEVLEPMNRRVYDGCCGSGGMVVQAERFVEVDGGQHRAAAHIGLKPSHLSQQLRVFAGPAWSTAAKPGPPSPTRSATRSSWTSSLSSGHGSTRSSTTGSSTGRTANRLRRPVNAPEQAERR
jgi:hypothetical protein